MIRFFLILVLLQVGGLFAQNSQSSRDYKQAKQKFAEINKKSLSANHLLEVYNSEIELEKNYLASLEAEIQQITTKLESTQKSINSFNSELESTKKVYSDLLFYAYKTKRERETASYFWASDDFETAYKRFVYVRFMNDYISAVGEQLIQSGDSLKRMQESMNSNLEAKQQLMSTRTDRMIDLASKVDQQKKYISNLSKQKSKLSEEIKTKERKAKALRSTVTKSVEKEKSIPQSPESKTFVSLKGKLPAPVNGVISSSFGEHRHSVLENVKVKNDGVDYTVSSGLAVSAVADGKVVNVIAIPGANFAVLLQHGDYFTVYSNLVNVKVSDGQLIKANQKLGEVFYKPGSPDSGILNFQVWNRNIKQNPQAWLRR